ncbi:dienelactone hydrolase family protein [Amphibiibacter pelophylacis]|uniref:Dienelactone hydrolase family protein n=1 Tax=Amphibiibacter pelophylacis TaxID=1799477 RepID=A0ACC6P1Q3_9BURK
MSSPLSITALDGSGTFSGYLALPPGGTGPGLVMAQEIFGVNFNMRELADTFAQLGYVVAVPDLFWRIQPGIELGYTPEDWKKAFEYFQALDQGKAVEDIQATLTALRAHPAVAGGKAGVVGYCLGGKLAYLAACRTDSDVSVGYYGVGIEAALDEAANIRQPVLLHIAEKDGFCPPEAREAIVKAFAGHAQVTTQVYPGVDHAFARPAGEHYDAAAATLANQRTADALAQHLKG